MAGAVEVMGMALDPITESELIARVIDSLGRNQGGWAVTANLDQLRQFRSSAELQRLLAGAEVIVADGMPLVWASRLQGTPLPERVAGSDLVWSLTAAAAAAGRSVYLLGDQPPARVKAELMLSRRFPSLRLAGACSPPLGFEHDPDEIERVRAGLLATRPDIVYVALGFPKQEQLIVKLRSDLPHAWFIGVGISLSFLGGHVRRAPPWMSRLGLEWAHRLWQEPRRLARRYLVHGLPFGARLLVHALGVRLRRRPRRRTHTLG